MSPVLNNNEISTSGDTISIQTRKRRATLDLEQNESKIARKKGSFTYHSSTQAVPGDSALPKSLKSGKLVKTRILIVSDTHAADFNAANKLLQHADVAIHCGDLTDNSKMDQFRSAFRLLNDLNAPLKLAIPGNHDFTMDPAVYRKNMAETQRLDPSIGRELWVQEFGEEGEARKIFEEATDKGIVLLKEGCHSFALGNGAQLTIYASPSTPSGSHAEFGLDWGFQYHPDDGHDYAIEKGVDIAITHGPPRGIIDYRRRGCPDLFRAIARARPRVHCFGHVHRSWGAKLVTWKDDIGETPSHFTAIDNDRSVLVENLARLKACKSDTAEDIREKKRKIERYTKERCCKTSHCREGPDPLRQNDQTLFVNAAFKGDTEEFMEQVPWLVDIELPIADRDMAHWVSN